MRCSDSVRPPSDTYFLFVSLGIPINLFDITILQDLEAREQMLIQNMKRNRRDCVDVEPRHSISLLNTTHTRIFPH